jgi:trehalose 6-phosphate phosphatase
VIVYNDPVELAALVAASPRPTLIGLDVDGVLAPIVGHADAAMLVDGVLDVIHSVAGLVGMRVAVVSGRSVDDLGRFGFGADIDVIGSHGAERRGRPLVPLDDVERSRLARLDDLTVAAVDRAGVGAWIERKPTSVVLHVREADRARGNDALIALERDAGHVQGATTKRGNGIVELFARPADKGLALLSLADELGALTTVFAGDDATDEEAFARLQPGDIAIKVGDNATAASHRLRDPADVLAWLRALSNST